MGKKNRVRSGVIFNVISAFICIGIGLIAVVAYNNLFGWVLLIPGILILLLTPLSTKWSKRQADREEMLDEYLKNKPNK